DWFGSRFIWIFAILTVLGLTCMIIWETMIVDDPIVDLPLLANANLSTSMVLQFIVGFILTSTTVLIPQFVQQILGYNATNAGLILMPGGFALMVMMPVAGFLVGKFQPKYLMAFGLILTAASMYWLTGFNTQVAFRNLVYVRVLQCIGLPLFFIPLNTIAYSNLPPGKSNNASAMMNLMRNLGGGIGISVAATLLTRRAQFHQNRLASNATHAFRPFVNHINATGGFTARNLIGFYQTVEIQAAMLSYLDVFKIFTIGTLLIVTLVLLLRRVKPTEKPVMVH
ncbi:MAG TPA: MFS transporter, partial [Tepidisphaeraceae bacterium]|nr:MFS transporter [Tepidisphaeraceae bacterium]